MIFFSVFKLREQSILVQQNKCKISPFCAFDDKSMKLGTKLGGIIRNIFSYRAIADLSRDPNGGHFKNDVIKGVNFPLSCSNLQNVEE